MTNSSDSNHQAADHRPEVQDSQQQADELVARVMNQETAAEPDSELDYIAADGDQLQLEERHALRRRAGLSTELEDVSEVEYRQLRLERVLLAGIHEPGEQEEAENSLQELAALAHTAGSEVLGGVLQKRYHPDAATYLGSGKAAELAELAIEVQADTVIIDSELSPSQRRALEDVVKIKVIDRTALILDIFAQHAQSKDGKAQVELAQLEYLLPRLRGWGESMSRQAGGQVAGGAGIGSRGPGETKIEMDRRRIRTRMAKLRRQLKKLEPARKERRQQRQVNRVPAVAIVGYTNAGKSSIMNRLTGAGVLVENALFATLDPTVRRATTDDGRVYTLADTVGFVRRLPTQLVEAFRSTLEETALSDVIVHVVDASHPEPLAQIEAVHSVLADIEGVEQVPEIIVLNKADIAEPENLLALRTSQPQALIVSAYTGEGMAELQERIAKLLPQQRIQVSLFIPYDEGQLVSRIYDDGQVLEISHSEQGTQVEALIDPQLAHELSAFQVSSKT